MTAIAKEISTLLSEHRHDIWELWNKYLIVRAKSVVEVVGVDETKARTRTLLDNLIHVLPAKDDKTNESYQKVMEVLAKVSRRMSEQNMTPSETAMFILSVKEAVFPVIQEHFDDKKFADAIITVNHLIDHFALTTFEVYLDSREELISDQQNAFREISVPVVKVWEKIIMIPLIGMLDSERTQMMMEVLLTALEDMQSKVAILDISGIPVVDTLVARHLITAASAVRLMGAECIITGVRAKIAQTLVQLGVDLGGFTTCTTMADGLQLALELTDQKIG
ncbi:STAS domain-containing protein [Desulfonema magnum]|uniref:STAS domain-containing protein n=1 Tax=Desulfonema magnum TaxID=45655 RepID=A0A975GNR2_9BACT|nr:STAS domain-containing protein [Desulfonema magnum]QTA88050.1 STAS domain-containing protein [Desulfonema magnum]